MFIYPAVPDVATAVEMPDVRFDVKQRRGVQDIDFRDAEVVRANLQNIDRFQSTITRLRPLF